MLIWIMFLLYILLSGYLLWRMIHWLKLVIPFFKHVWTQAALFFSYIVLASTLILGGLLRPCMIQVSLKKIGNYWLGTFIYILFFILIADIIVLIMKLINRKHPIPLLKKLRGFYIIGIFVISLSIVFSVYGFVHARKIKDTSYNITVNKKVPSVPSMKIALVADLHLGYSIGTDMMHKMVSHINTQSPDLVVIAGDIFDNDYDSLDNPKELIKILSSIKSKYGVYAVYGNHDVSETLIGGFSLRSGKYAFRDKRMDEFLKKANIKVLTDDVTTIVNDKMYLIGRLDKEKAGDGTSNRMSIEKLTSNLDKTKPIIVLEHEPAELQSVANSGADIMLCGHTHAGQYFPLTIAQPIAWENYYGLLKKDNMYNFVTSGVGVYGPYMRVLTDSEVMTINVKFK